MFISNIIMKLAWVGYEEFCRRCTKLLSTEAKDNTLRDLQNSSYPTKAEFINCFYQLLFIKKYFPLLKRVLPFRSLFCCSPKITQTCPQFFSVNGSIIYSGLLFWRHVDIIASIWSNFWCHQLNMTKFFPNLVNSSWLRWIMHVVLTNQ